MELADQYSGVIQLRPTQSRQFEANPPVLSRTLPQCLDMLAEIYLQLRRLELEHEREECQLQREREDYQQQFELRKLELEFSKNLDPSAPPADSGPISTTFL